MNAPARDCEKLYSLSARVFFPAFTIVARYNRDQLKPPLDTIVLCDVREVQGVFWIGHAWLEVTPGSRTAVRLIGVGFPGFSPDRYEQSIVLPENSNWKNFKSLTLIGIIRALLKSLGTTLPLCLRIWYPGGVLLWVLREMPRGVSLSDVRSPDRWIEIPATPGNYYSSAKA